MADIKRLLKKKRWTGRELGIIEITNMAVLFSQTLQGKDPKPLVEASQLQDMVNGIDDYTQEAIYNNYLSIHTWLSVRYNIAQTQLQQAQVQMRTLWGIITPAILAEDIYSYASQLPVVMTQKQYDDRKAAEIEAGFKDKDGNEKYGNSNVFGLISEAVGYFLDKLYNEPTKANPLKAIRKKYINKPVKSRLILDRWNEVTGEGYYTLEDGRRSDQMTKEEWQDAIAPPEIEEVLAKDVSYRRVIQKAKIIFDGGTEEEADRQEADYKAGLATPCQWHYKEEPPTDLTKWDVIEEEALLNFYPASLDGEDCYTESNFAASMEDFKKEFPELVTAILKEIDKRYFKEGEGLSSLPVSEWKNPVFSVRQLYEMDFFDFRETYESIISESIGGRRATRNGIAILKQDDEEPDEKRYIDENGYFVEPTIENSYKNYSLEGFFTDAEDYAENIDFLEDTKETLLDSYYYLIGYNYAIDRIATIHDIPELAVFKFDIEELATRIEALNDLIPLLYGRIKDIDYMDKELQAKKLQVLQDYFQPIDYKSLAIPEENKAEADVLIANFGAFRQEEMDHFWDLLFERPTEKEGT